MRGALSPRLVRTLHAQTCNVITNLLCSCAGWPIRDDGRLIFTAYSQMSKSIHKVNLRSIPGESWVRIQGRLTKSIKRSLLQKARISWLGIESTTYPFQGQGGHRWATGNPNEVNLFLLELCQSGPSCVPPGQQPLGHDLRGRHALVQASPRRPARRQLPQQAKGHPGRRPSRPAARLRAQQFVERRRSATSL